MDFKKYIGLFCQFADQIDSIFYSEYRMWGFWLFILQQLKKLLLDLQLLLQLNFIVRMSIVLQSDSLEYQTTLTL